MAVAAKSPHRHAAPDGDDKFDGYVTGTMTRFILIIRGRF
jgi:hypothetical protein